MEFLVEFEVEVPAGTPDAEVEQHQRAESAAAKLAGDGHLIRPWRRPLAGDGTTAIGLYRAGSQAAPDGLPAALLEGAETAAAFVTQYSDGGYTTNLPLQDVTGGKARVVFACDGRPLAPEHGGPARMLVPQHYFWKSAKWVRGLRLPPAGEPGFWEANGYHDYEDPWQEQRYPAD